VGGKLPGWMRGSVVDGKGMGDVVSGLTRFFDGKRAEGGLK